jgi:hypothetical protein
MQLIAVKWQSGHEQQEEEEEEVDIYEFPFVLTYGRDPMVMESGRLLPPFTDRFEDRTDGAAWPRLFPETDTAATAAAAAGGVVVVIELDGDAGWCLR